MSNQQTSIRNSKRSPPPNTKYNYIQTEPDEGEPNVQDGEFQLDEGDSLDKRYVGISISDSNFNENQYNDKPHQIPKTQQMKQRKKLPVTGEELKKKKSSQQIKTKVAKFFMEEKKPKVMAHKMQYGGKPTAKKPNMVKKTIDLNASGDENETLQPSSNENTMNKPSIYDQALQTMGKSSPQKNRQKMKLLKIEQVVKNVTKFQGLNSERQNKPVVFSFNLQEHIRNTSADHLSDEQYQSPQKAPSIDSDMDQTSDVVVNKIKTQQIDKNKFMRTQEIKSGGSSAKKPNVKVLTSFQHMRQKNSPMKNVSPQKYSAAKSKAQKPVKPQKTNSNNIGQLHHSKSNSLSITHSMKMIPKKQVVTTAAKKNEKKIVQFQTKPMPKRKREVEFEDKNSFKIAKQKNDAKPMSPRIQYNPQKSGNNQDIFPLSGEEKSFVDTQPLQSRFSLTCNDMDNQPYLQKNSSIKSPINVRTPSINQKHVNMVVEQSFASLPKKIVLPLKTNVMLQRPPGATESRQTNQSSRRDRSQTHHLPSSFNAGELQPEAKTHRLDKQQPKVKFEETTAIENNLLRRANLSVASGCRSNGSNTRRELSNLKLMRDQKKNSKSLLKYNGITSNQSETEDKLNLGTKLAEIQNQLNQLSELSAQDRSNHGSRRRLRSSSHHRKPGSTSQKSLGVHEYNYPNFSNHSALPPRQQITAETPQPTGGRLQRLPAKNAFCSYNMNVTEPMNTFNSTTKKVMIDLSSNPDINVSTRNFNLQPSGTGELDEDYEQSLQFVESFQGNSAMFKKPATRQVHTALQQQQPTMMQGGFSSYHKTTPGHQPEVIRTSSKNGRRQLQKHDSMTEKLSRELLGNTAPQKMSNYTSAFVQPQIEGHVRVKSEKSLGRGSSSQTRRGNLLFQKKAVAGVNFKEMQQ